MKWMGCNIVNDTDLHLVPNDAICGDTSNIEGCDACNNCPFMLNNNDGFWLWQDNDDIGWFTIKPEDYQYALNNPDEWYMENLL